MWINTATGATFTDHATIRNSMAYISLPSALTDEVLNAYGLEPVTLVAAQYDPVTQTATETTPELTVLGHWEQRWTVTDKSAEVIAAEAEAARIAAIPLSVSPRQIRQALTRAGLRTSVEAAIAAGDQDTKDWYEFATAFDRASPVVAALGVALSVSPTQLDDLWVLASSL